MAPAHPPAHPSAQPHIAALHGPGVPAERLDRLSAAVRLPRWSSAGNGETALVVLDSPEAVEPAALWEPPFAAWVELAALTDADLIQAVERAGHTHLFACVTTATANHLHLAGRVVAAIAARRPLSGEMRDDMELALHEAISNAVVHGNLQVEGMKGLSVAALERFSLDLAARMADPAFAERRVEVSVWLEDSATVVEVADEGTGFARTENVPDRGASGRGLDLIAAIAVGLELLDGGRRIRMRFPL